MMYNKYMRINSWCISIKLYCNLLEIISFEVTDSILYKHFGTGFVCILKYILFNIIENFKTFVLKQILY